MKKKIIFSANLFCLLVSWLVFASCDNSTESISYPYRIAIVEYIGRKEGLTSSSSEQEFMNGLIEKIISYNERQQITSDKIPFDGVVYEIDNIHYEYNNIPQYIPQFVRELCQEKFLKKPNCKIVGSCFLSILYEFPGKKEIGVCYAFPSIVKSVEGDVMIGYAITGELYPIK
jgi:hypothetical protein